MFKYIFILLLLFIVISLGGGYLYINEKLDENLQLADTITLEIPINTSNKSIIGKVNAFGGLQPNWLFQYLMKYYSKYENKFAYAGYYKFPPKYK
ncbi:hypothetical protein OAQ99_06570 [Candidatus Kapabacteria bacterium]|nr:hypothetical protein [Candidatus Kapabacteria bacterium]